MCINLPNIVLFPFIQSFHPFSYDHFHYIAFLFHCNTANLTIYIHIESPSCGIDEMSMWAQHAALSSFHGAYWPSIDWTGFKQFTPKTNIEMKRALSWTTANASMCRYFHAVWYFSAFQQLKWPNERANRKILELIDVMPCALHCTLHFIWISRGFNFTIDEKKRNNNHFPDENYSKNLVAQTITMTTITVRSPILYNDDYSAHI